MVMIINNSPVFSKINATAATLTKNRTPDSVSKLSGLCATCVDGCIGICEVGKSAFRGVEVIYPQPFGIITAASEKSYPVNFSHFNIMGGLENPEGIEADSDKFVFSKVNLEITIGRNNDIKLRLPFDICALGSTNIAANNWDGLAIGAAISGVMLTIGENVCGMDPNSEIKNGRVVRSPELERRVKLYKDWQKKGYGAIIVQANIEDTRLGVQEYAISKLGVDFVELKWGQGAKNIGGEVKLKTLEKAKLLKSRGYIVLPDPDDPAVVEAFKSGALHEFERHSRIGMIDEEAFLKRVEELRKAGAKYISLKTGAYTPAALALALKLSSIAQLDMLVVDAAGGGTGMSPWRMMNEWGVPPIELFTLLYEYVDKIAKAKKYIPTIAIAGGFSFEDTIFKGLALGAPYFRVIGMARAPLTAAMVGKTIGKAIEAGEAPVYVSRFGKTKEEIFITSSELKRELGKTAFEKLPTGAIGVYTYFSRLAQGLKQLIAGARKFDIKYISRNDIAALTREAAELTGITYIKDVDKQKVEKILSF